MPRAIKGAKVVPIRSFLGLVLGLSPRQLSRLFNGARGKIDPKRVRAYLLANGYRDPIEARRKQVEVGLRLIGSGKDRLA